MPVTALQHFREDIARARAIVAHADPLPVSTPAEQVLRSDLLRSAWMLSVGAINAYFCNAYTDLVAAALISKSRHANMILPEFFYDIRLPVRAVLESYAANANWKWRMAARKMMDRENVLSLQQIQKLFNPFFRKGWRFYGDLLGSWMIHSQSTVRLFGIAPLAYGLLTPNQQDAAKKRAKQIMEERYKSIFQRRHDCIHNCDRPKTRPQAMDRARTVIRVIEDAEFLVNRSDEHIHTEFRKFLIDKGCPTLFITQVGY